LLVTDMSHLSACHRKSFLSQKAPLRCIEMCANIDFGKTLNINNQDFFGDAVNLASKLGEDSH